MSIFDFFANKPVTGGLADLIGSFTNDRGNITPESVISPEALRDYRAQKTQTQPAQPVLGSQVKAAAMGAIPSGVDLALNYIKSQTPGNQDVMQYYPALKYPGFLDAVKQADKKRQGLANLLLLQGFFESTLGRGGPALFGTISSANRPDLFDNPINALNYQLSPSVLGGGVGGKLNILNSNRPLTVDEVRSLYKSYDPPGAYINNIASILGGE